MSYRLPFGLSCCYTSKNVDAIGSEEYFDQMIEWGAKFCWFFTYMPVGKEAVLELMATAKQRANMYHQICKFRETKPLKFCCIILHRLSCKIRTSTLTSLLIKHSNGYFGKAKSMEIIEAAKSSFGVEDSCGVYTDLIRNYMKHIKFTSEQVAVLDGKIAALMEEFDTPITTIFRDRANSRCSYRIGDRRYFTLQVSGQAGCICRN